MIQKNLVLCAAFIALSSSLVRAADEAPKTQPVVHDYREIDGQALHAHVFTPAIPESKAAPAVLLFHGGGWSVGSPEWTYSAAQRFAANGLVAIPVEYRLSNGEVTPIDAQADVCAAFRWVRSRHAELGIDPQRVVGYGVSAGGQLVSGTATYGCPDTGPEAESAAPNLLLLWSPALDMARDGWFERKLQGRAPASDYSPLEHVGKATPATCIVQGDADTLTPLSGAKGFCAALAKQGTECVLDVHAGVGHLMTRNLAEQERDFDPDPEAVAAGVKRQLEFLRAHGYIEADRELRL